MTFRDRDDAGRRLGWALAQRPLARPIVVLGIPRGGVPVAAHVARALDAPLGVVVARKIGAPWSPELAIGATTANGATYIDPRAVEETETDDAYVASERARQIREAQRREELFFAHGRPDLAGKHAIVVDDGLATGATAIAAVRSVKSAGANRVTLAVPVGAPGSVARLASEADDVFCLVAEPYFRAVGELYGDFSQVTDEQAQAVLEGLRSVTAARPLER